MIDFKKLSEDQLKLVTKWGPDVTVMAYSLYNYYLNKLGCDYFSCATGSVYTVISLTRNRSPDKYISLLINNLSSIEVTFGDWKNKNIPPAIYQKYTQQEFIEKMDTMLDWLN